MYDPNDDLLLMDDEEAAGFSIRTLTYPENYELPELADDSGRRLERAVALVLDENRRIKRRQTGDGYVLEAFDGSEWSVTAEFASLDEVVSSDRYGHWKVEASASDDALAGDEEPEYEDES